MTTDQHPFSKTIAKAKREMLGQTEPPTISKSVEEVQTILNKCMTEAQAQVIIKDILSGYCNRQVAAKLLGKQWNASMSESDWDTLAKRVIDDAKSGGFQGVIDSIFSPNRPAQHFKPLTENEVSPGGEGRGDIPGTQGPSRGGDYGRPAHPIGQPEGGFTDTSEGMRWSDAGPGKREMVAVASDTRDMPKTRLTQSTPYGATTTGLTPSDASAQSYGRQAYTDSREYQPHDTRPSGRTSGTSIPTPAMTGSDPHRYGEADASVMGRVHKTEEPSLIKAAAKRWSKKAEPSKELEE